eukprot:gb/GECG01015416.1/.p1 GENE.gb/GECG01015416.1/~~gb/GECG01015416.1/.p1  ORF type:complete len:643 (+),score=103.90 gb/GECG01015416.1/:1-1929(+)
MEPSKKEGSGGSRGTSQPDQQQQQQDVGRGQKPHRKHAGNRPPPTTELRGQTVPRSELENPHWNAPEPEGALPLSQYLQDLERKAKNAPAEKQEEEEEIVKLALIVICDDTQLSMHDKFKAFQRLSELSSEHQSVQEDEEEGCTRVFFTTDIENMPEYVRVIEELNTEIGEGEQLFRWRTAFGKDLKRINFFNRPTTFGVLHKVLKLVNYRAVPQFTSDQWSKLLNDSDEDLPRSITVYTMDPQLLQHLAAFEPTLYKVAERGFTVQASNRDYARSYQKYVRSADLLDNSRVWSFSLLTKTSTAPGENVAHQVSELFSTSQKTCKNYLGYLTPDWATPEQSTHDFIQFKFYFSVSEDKKFKDVKSVVKTIYQTLGNDDKLECDFQDTRVVLTAMQSFTKDYGQVEKEIYDRYALRLHPENRRLACFYCGQPHKPNLCPKLVALVEDRDIVKRIINEADENARENIEFLKASTNECFLEMEDPSAFHNRLLRAEGLVDPEPEESNVLAEVVPVKKQKSVDINTISQNALSRIREANKGADIKQNFEPIILYRISGGTFKAAHEVQFEFTRGTIYCTDLEEDEKTVDEIRVGDIEGVSERDERGNFNLLAKNQTMNLFVEENETYDYFSSVIKRLREVAAGTVA